MRSKVKVKVKVFACSIFLHCQSRILGGKVKERVRNG